MNGSAEDRSSNLQDWVGRTETATDVLTASSLERLWATVGRKDDPPKVGDPLPPLSHWLYCLSAANRQELGEDGHEKRGNFIPPIELPRRMWASSQIRFVGDLRVGQIVRRVSKVSDVTPKTGRTGALVFVKLEHEIDSETGPGIRETQNVVYRDTGGTVSQPANAGRPADWTRTVVPDEVLLFRYSALTFNGHRIHYDLPYTTSVEGYPGLLVHGPLIATLLLDLARDNMPDQPVTGIDIRALAPLFHNASFNLNGKRTTTGADLWACDKAGGIAMEIQLHTAV